MRHESLYEGNGVSETALLAGMSDTASLDYLGLPTGV